MDLSEHVVEDYRALRFSLKAHPLSFLRQSLAREGIVEAMQLEVLKPGILVRVAGLVLVRQRPGDSGVIFSKLEAETGLAHEIGRATCRERGWQYGSISGGDDCLN